MTRDSGASPEDLEALSSRELHDRAVRRAVHHLDVAFLWRLLKELPAGEAAAKDLHDGRWYDSVLMSILDHEWAARRSPS